MEFIANTFTGNDVGDYNFNFLDDANERGGSDNQSRTTSAHLYEFTSKNGSVVSASDIERHEYCITPSQGSHPRYAWVRRHSRHSARRALQEYCDSDKEACRLSHRCSHPRQWDRSGRHYWHLQCTLHSVRHLTQDPVQQDCLPAHQCVGTAIPKLLQG